SSPFEYLLCCCGFQLCNVFRSNAMEIDQCLLESLSPSQRQRLVKRLRSDQVRAYYEREKSSPAIYQGQSEKKKVPKIRFHACDILQDAIVHHDHKEVLRLLKDGADLNTAIPSGGSLLHLCARHDNSVVSELLINMGLNVDRQDEELWTALHVACACDSPETVLLLLAGANLWLQDINGKVPLDYAVEGTETSYILLKYLEEKGKNSSTCGYTEVMSQLLESGASTKVAGSSSSPPLQLAVKNGHITLIQTQINQNKTELSLFQVKLMPPAPNDDLASLSELTDSSLLYEMQKRFGNDQIYTYIGHILLLVNPNKELPIYSTLVSQLYLSRSGRPSPSLPPHIFSSAERAFHTMLGERRPQCFVLSGESGSGKTVACQHIVQHLMARSGPVSLALDSRIQHANCILEAFGHARTEMNNNSSRFIKFLSLQYSEKTLIIKLYVYLLEKSRLVCPPRCQRNFNIFYLMAEGMSSEEKSSLFLTDVLAHRSTGQCFTHRESWGITIKSSAFVPLCYSCSYFLFQEVENLFRILSAVLHVGDLAFASHGDADTVFVTDPCLLDQVSAMLQVPSQHLGSALTSDVKYLKGDVISTRHTVEMANFYRDLLATSLYSNIFSFLANCLSYYLKKFWQTVPNLEIGILDIFGFEEFKKNGFEQLCINMTNERIHQYITETLFKEEHLECQQEGITMETSYTLRDQTPVLNFFFQEPDGLLSVLDSESRALQPEEQNAYQKLQAHQISVSAGSVIMSAQDGNGNPPLENQGPIFSIRHYAGKTTYDLSGSVEKNKDNLPRSILFVMRCKSYLSSPLPFFSFSSQQNSHLKFSFKELRNVITNSLFEITDKLKCCTPHFIQCVKPNGLKRPDSFDSLHVSAQLQHVGVLEMVKMIRYGYPIRLPFISDYFLCHPRFRDLAAMTLRSDRLYSVEEKCRHVLQHSKLQGWQMGYNKVFLGYWQANQLDEQCHQLQRKIVICQKVVRGWLVRMHTQPRVRVQQREVSKVPGFPQATEDLGQLAYDSPVIQTASSIPRESGNLRKMIHSPVGKQEEAHISPVPLPLSVESLVHSAAGLSIKAPTQQTEGGGGGSGLSSPRKQPPPKPKRDPNTRLSTSIDAVSASLSVCPQNTLADALSKPRPHSDDYSAVKKVPPPKPIRSPNTKLTGSFEEISVPRASEVNLSKATQGLGASVDGPHRLYRSQEEESVYIEMVGHPRITFVQKPGALEPGEAVYEEMKYPKSDVGATEMKILQTTSEMSSPPPNMETNQVATDQGSGASQTYCKGGPSDVPSPFPNLLPHRPPLLAFPLPTVPYSSALDESPLTPLEVKKLPVLETNLNYSGQAEGGARQRSDPSTTPVSKQDRLTPPLSPALGLPSPAKLPPPYKNHCHTPFACETSVLVVTRGVSVANSTKGCQKAFQGSSEAPPATGRPPYSPVKKSHPDSRQSHSCCSSPLLFNPSNARPLSSPLDELSTLISAGRSLLKKSTNGRRIRESGQYVSSVHIANMRPTSGQSTLHDLSPYLIHLADLERSFHICITKPFFQRKEVENLVGYFSW
uniref:Myosin XVI n=1 Tax=Scleropages formosus TaxID=113540 RepID=A0A8C9RQH2_SCLFO